MVIDSSALIAILWHEAERDSFNNAITKAPTRKMSAVTKLECSMVAAGKRDGDVFAKVDELLIELDITVLPFTDHHAQIARDAFIRYGKGRHKAGLNFGDCASYALAKAEAEPLLFKGTDFGGTDVEVVGFAA